VKNGIQIGFVAVREAFRLSFTFFLEQPVAEALIDGEPETPQASVIVPNSTGC